jgi:RNA polymerase I-specific transcription initiation factor RRN3
MCAAAVVSQFARMAHKTDFMYCHSIIEQNKRQSRSRLLLSSFSAEPSSAAVTPTLEHPYSGIPSASLPAGPTRSASQSSQQPSMDRGIVQDTLRAAQIDSHFPFDPYKLPLSAPFIQGIYRNWDGGGFEDDEDSDEDEEDDGEEADSSTADEETSTEAEAATAGHDAHDESADSDMQASSMDSDAILETLRPAFPSGALSIKGMIDPDLVSDDDEENAAAFSQSFEAMSVSPRFNRSLLSAR